MKPRTIRIGLACVILSLPAAGAQAGDAGDSPAAYWRFEDGRAFEQLLAQRGTTAPPLRTTADHAGNNPLRTFNTDLRVWPADTSPVYASDVPAPAVRQTGEINRLSLDFTPNQDIYTFGPEPGGAAPIDALPLPAFTIQGAFKLDRVPDERDGRYQVVIGKDGSPGDGPNAPVQVVVAGRSDDWTVRGAPAVQVIDARRRFVSVSSPTPVDAGRWVWFAAVCDGKELALWLDRGDGRGYVREAVGEVQGGLIESTGTWTIGRGMHGDGPGMWFDGKIDEIRINAAALAPQAFLNAGAAPDHNADTDAAPDQTDNAEVAPAFPTPGPDGATYTNPVLEHLPDPHVLKVGDIYYAYGTSDPDRGYRTYSSKDLVQWTDRGMVYEKNDQTWGRLHHWAPCVVQADGRFYLFYSVVGPLADTGGREGHRICVAVADSPLGPFQQARAPLFGVGQSTIDAHVLIDHDGRAYLYYVLDVSDNEVSEVFVVRLSDDLLSIVGEPVYCIGPDRDWEGSAWNEGPFVFRHGDTYLMLYSANGFFDPRYAVGYAVAASPMGPWVKSPRNPILQANERVRGPGHCSVVPSPDGSEFFIVYHAHHDGGGVRRRPMYIDRLIVTPGQGHRLNLSVLGPTRDAQPVPATPGGTRP